MPSFIPEYIDESLDRNVFNKLRIRYMFALCAIAISLIYSATLVQRHLKNQLFDSRIINVAGRQRMLSQKITKTLLLISNNPSSKGMDNLKVELNEALNLWIISHEGLLHGNDSLGLPNWNSPKIDSMFFAIDPYFTTMVDKVKSVQRILNSGKVYPKSDIDTYISAILVAEPYFLGGMDKIVFQYDKDAKYKVNRLIKTEVGLVAISLFILLFELIFIFTPIANYIRNIIADLIDSENKEKKMNKELRKLYQILEASQQELRELYYAVDQAIMFARTNNKGQLSFLSDKFKLHLKIQAPVSGENIFNILISDDLNKEKLEQILNYVIAGNIWKNEVQVNISNEKSWLMLTIVPVPDETSQISQLVFVCSNINERKQTEEQLKIATQEKFIRGVAEEKAKSSLILEGQEKERRRISREIHDGIGQLLTGLKFQIESIDGTQTLKTNEKIEEIKNLTANIIREVRRVSHNLAPSVLNDYGLFSALKTIVNDLTGFSKTNIALENITGFNLRLERRIEINIFRIIQEALNNALKHAHAENIMISITEAKNQLIIIIEDDGKGFLTSEIVVEDIEKMSGRGIFNMRERAGFIDAIFDIEASPGKGTTIKLEIPYKQYLK